MSIDVKLFLDILGFDSTSGKELELSNFLEKKLAEPVAGRCPRVQAWSFDPDDLGTPASAPVAHDTASAAPNATASQASPASSSALATTPGAASASPASSSALATTPVAHDTDLVTPNLSAKSEQPGTTKRVSRNLLFSWGEPKVVFCTHLDTVPPYIPPTVEGNQIRGRGTCDAKGQIIALYTACKTLVSEGYDGFGLLLLSGEEMGSFGAKAFSHQSFKAPYLIIGEPTEGKMVSAAKGTKYYNLTFTGEAFHSGYPQFGRSAIDAFVDFVNTLRAIDFPVDPVLGNTTWNIGRLHSDNPQNILSPLLSCALYFRTTFATDALVSQIMSEIGRKPEGTTEGSPSFHKFMKVEPLFGEAPSQYFTIPGFNSTPVAFGTDAPHLNNFTHRAICGPGSIRFAHRDDEQITLSELEEAATQYVAMFKALQ